MKFEPLPPIIILLRTIFLCVPDIDQEDCSDDHSHKIFLMEIVI